MIDKNFVYSRIGMALISAQRVEYITRELVYHLKKFDKELYGITTSTFLENTPSAQKLRKNTLGQIFKLLKLNPQFVLDEELSDYLKKRNILAHDFWQKYLYTVSENQTKNAIDFLYDFGKHSEKVEHFYKGFIYLLALRHVTNSKQLDAKLQKWEHHFTYFLDAIDKNKL